MIVRSGIITVYLHCVTLFTVYENSVFSLKCLHLKIHVT